jgi:hypothetical protein
LSISFRLKPRHRGYAVGWRAFGYCNQNFFRRLFGFELCEPPRKELFQQQNDN